MHLRCSHSIGSNIYGTMNRGAMALEKREERVGDVRSGGQIVCMYVGEHVRAWDRHATVNTPSQLQHLVAGCTSWIGSRKRLVKAAL